MIADGVRTIRGSERLRREPGGQGFAGFCRVREQEEVIGLRDDHALVARGAGGQRFRVGGEASVFDVIFQGADEPSGAGGFGPGFVGFVRRIRGHHDELGVGRGVGGVDTGRTKTAGREADEGRLGERMFQARGGGGEGLVEVGGGDFGGIDAVGGAEDEVVGKPLGELVLIPEKTAAVAVEENDDGGVRVGLGRPVKEREAAGGAGFGEAVRKRGRNAFEDGARGDARVTTGDEVAEFVGIAGGEAERGRLGECEADDGGFGEARGGGAGERKISGAFGGGGRRRRGVMRGPGDREDFLGAGRDAGERGDGCNEGDEETKRAHGIGFG